MLTIIEDKEVSDALYRAIEDWARVDDAWVAITWAISRDPHFGDPVTESGNLRAVTLEGANSIGLPTITILYEIDPPEIIVKKIRFDKPRFQHGNA